MTSMANSARGPRHHRLPGIRTGAIFQPCPPAWSRSEIIGYIDHCRQRARDTLEDMTDEKAATPLPPAHRYKGQPYAWILTGLVVHTTEHASQIRQFIAAAGIALDVPERP